MSIHDMLNKIKGSTGIDSTTALYFMVIIGVGVSSFGLGRLSVGDSANTAMAVEGTRESIQKLPQTRFSTTGSIGLKTNSQSGNYVASKNGKLYYTKGCKAANRIKPENKVWFMDASEAESMGYTRSLSCK